MKTKQFREKLNLNKKTIANLDEYWMSRVKGGRSEGGITIPPCETNTCTCPPTDTCNNCGTIECDSDPLYISCPVIC